jgi:WhiB family redox-sensing transcriptional regulator
VTMIDEGIVYFTGGACLCGAPLVRRDGRATCAVYGSAHAQPTWHESAACRGLDPDLFFPDGPNGNLNARKVCSTCPVARECYAAAVERCEQFGIWGGVSFDPDTRRRHETRVA